MAKQAKRYKDLPRYPAIYGYEDDFKKSFSQILKATVKEVGNKLKESV